MSCTEDESEEPPGPGRRSYRWNTLPPTQRDNSRLRRVRCYYKTKMRRTARPVCLALVWMAGPSVGGLFSCRGGFSVCQLNAPRQLRIPLSILPDRLHFPMGNIVAISPHSLPGLGVSHG
jgi:hypothetical protein